MFPPYYIPGSSDCKFRDPFSAKSLPWTVLQASEFKIFLCGFSAIPCKRSGVMPPYNRTGTRRCGYAAKFSSSFCGTRSGWRWIFELPREYDARGSWRAGRPPDLFANGRSRYRGGNFRLLWYAVGSGGDIARAAAAGREMWELEGLTPSRPPRP